MITEERGDNIIIRFVRPEIRNPLSLDILERLADTLAEISTQDHIKGVIFTGTGNVFASGANLREIDAVTAATAKDFARKGQRLMQMIADTPQETTAAINGFCYGGALDLALSCDRRIASANATFAHPGTSLGIITGWSGTQRLPRLIGQARALELFFTAEPISAQQAFAIGLVDKVLANVIDYALE